MPKTNMPTLSDRTRPIQPHTLDELLRHIPYLFSGLASRWPARQNRALAEKGLNTVTYRALAVLAMHESLSVNEIATLVVAEQSTTSRMVDALVDAGLVERSIAVADLRRRTVAITRAGRDLLAEAAPIIDANYRRLITGIPAEQLDLVADVMFRMMQNVQLEDADGQPRMAGMLA